MHPLPKDMRLFKKRIRIQVVRSTALRVEDWRQSPELVTYAAKLLNTPEFRTLLDVLRNESPANFGFPVTGVSAEDRITYAGRIEGYNQAMNLIESLGTPGIQRARLEATFEPETQPN